MNIAEFQHKITQAQKPVIVDFWAPWCVPCRLTKPALEKLAGEYAGKVDFLPVEADESGEVLRHFRVMGIPTVLSFQGGVEAGRLVGARDESSYRTFFEAVAAGKEVKAPMALSDRLVRLGAGTFLLVFGLSTGNWLVAAAGGLVAFLGVYDRCPVWAAITGMLRRK